MNSKPLEVDVEPGTNGRFYWTVTASNGKITGDSAQGNGYASRSAARRAATTHFERAVRNGVSITDDKGKRTAILT